MKNLVQFSNKYQLKPHLHSQSLNADIILDTELLTKSVTKSDCKIAIEINKLSFSFTTNKELKKRKKFTNKKFDESNTEKCAVFLNLIFDYIYLASCQRLFLLT